MTVGKHRCKLPANLSPYGQGPYDPPSHPQLLHRAQNKTRREPTGTTRGSRDEIYPFFLRERHKSCQPHGMPVLLALCRESAQNHGKLAAVYGFEIVVLSKREEYYFIMK